MSATPPPGFGYFAIVHQVTGSTHTPTVTCGFQNGGSFTAAAANAALRAAMVSGTNFWDVANFSNAYLVQSTYVLVNIGGLLYTDTNVVPIAGTASIATPPINTAAIIQKRTGVAGRQYRGRMFMPPMNVAEGDVSIAGIIGGASFTNLGTYSTAFYGGLVAQAMTPYLLHEAPLVGAPPAPTIITSFAPTQLIGSYKKRIRS